MLLWYIVVTGIIAGMLPGLLKLDKVFSIPNIVVGVIGALVGAFLGFGDAPLLLEYPFLNEKTLMISLAIVFVLVKVSIMTRRQSS